MKIELSTLILAFAAFMSVCLPAAAKPLHQPCSCQPQTIVASSTSNSGGAGVVPDYSGTGTAGQPGRYFGNARIVHIRDENDDGLWPIVIAGLLTFICGLAIGSLFKSKSGQIEPVTEA
jgi:hypothetical protein